ncbi:MAG: hypothetical protein QF541_05875 [Lentisphaeria bacterium]|nr:hypothetical protein [Lentisphaeria bacterium]
MTTTANCGCDMLTVLCAAKAPDESPCRVKGTARVSDPGRRRAFSEAGDGCNEALSTGGKPVFARV